ncbi:MAG TPA: DUF2062 domain-containing protein [Candidatus Polarisedimenticolaceae bacterium]|nr:DUF2062 domain-containing protein [Candidatus Polarisedimenticolaceae bacterium]
MDRGASIPRRRWRVGRALSELHYRLRTEGDSDLRTAGSVGLGTVVGCLPVYGAHLLLCVALARLLRVSRIKTYLAAHVNNPLSAPWLLYLEYGIGHQVFGGEWPRVSVAGLRSVGIAELGRDLIVGSLVVGVALGAVMAGLAYAVRVRARAEGLFDRLREETSRRYLDAGMFHWEFVRGKLRYDPVYRTILETGVLPADGRLVDLGCGRGIVLALLGTARALHRTGGWTTELPAPPSRLRLAGVERRESTARVARLATGGEVPIEVEDLCDHEPAAADAVLLLDVLHYLSAEHQARLIRRIAAKLPRGGIVLIREADAARGLRFRFSAWSERLAAILRLRWRQRFCYRAARSWCELIESAGFETRVWPMWGRTPHGNVLIVAHKT